jgi:hypothetical protein
MDTLKQSVIVPAGLVERKFNELLALLPSFTEDQLNDLLTQCLQREADISGRGRKLS